MGILRTCRPSPAVFLCPLSLAAPCINSTLPPVLRRDTASVQSSRDSLPSLAELRGSIELELERARRVLESTAHLSWSSSVTGAPGAAVAVKQARGAQYPASDSGCRLWLLDPLRVLILPHSSLAASTRFHPFPIESLEFIR